jgi:predicted  nucleic acid-binding Zn-ribbon protein
VKPETTSLRDALAAAEAELDVIAPQVKEAYRKYQELNDQQTAKGYEVRELRRQIREEQTP